MKRKIPVWGLAICVLTMIVPGSTRGEDEGASPDELYRKAYLLERDGRRTLHGGDLPAAYNSLSAALEVYEKVARDYPEWRPAAIGARTAAVRQETETIGREIFSLPEGTVEIVSGMVREGDRYEAGRRLAGQVRAAGESRYDVEGSTVTLVREGPLLGASCSCPDFTYRGSEYGFACKHIWAVVFNEKLLE